MKIENDALQIYRREGMLFMPDVFTEREVSALVSELERLLSLDLQSHLRAESGELLGTTVMNESSALYDRLLRDERLVQPAEQILGGPVYAHQYNLLKL